MGIVRLFAHLYIILARIQDDPIACTLQGTFPLILFFRTGYRNIPADHLRLKKWRTWKILLSGLNFFIIWVNQKYSMKDTFYVSIACNDLTTFPRLRGTITIRSTFWSIRAFHPFPTPFKYCVTCWIVQATLEFLNFYTFNRWALFIPVWFSTGHRAVRYKCFIWTIGIPFTPCGLI